MENSPISELFKRKAIELDLDGSSAQAKKDALTEAYKKLIQAQQYEKLPMRDPGLALGGIKSLVNSDNKIYQNAGNMFAGFMESDLNEFARKQAAQQLQAKTALEQSASDIDLMNNDRNMQLKYLSAADDSDYKSQIARLKELMIASDMKQQQPVIVDKTKAARELGVPAYAGPDPYEGLDDVGKRQVRMGFEKKVSKEQDEAGDLQKQIDTMKRFSQLNEKVKNNIIGTGPIADYVPNWSEDIQEMEAKSSELIPQMRVPGSGSTSDFDAAMFQKATVGTNKDYEPNKNIAEAFILARQTQMQKADFLESYLAANNHIRGADIAWKKYLDSNPIFADEDFTINQKRKTWQDYFGKIGDDDSIPDASSVIPKGFDPEDWKYLTPEEQAAILRKRGS